jgi:hypothetical protein
MFTVKDKGGKADRNPFSPYLWFQKSIQKPENAEDYAQKPQ